MKRSADTAAPGLGQPRQKTELAQPGTAPPIDRAQLQHVIEGLSDGVILIEPDQTIAWANQAALMLHGVDTVDALGRTVDDYRARFELHGADSHTLPPGHTPMDRLLAGESFSEIIVEVGPRGEKPRWIHQIRSLILTGVDGGAHCLVLLINDLTEQYEAEDRFERMFNANPAPAIICRLSDLRYCKVNVGFEQLTGFTSGALLGRSMHEVDILARADQRALAVERLHTGKTIPQMEAWLPAAGGQQRLVLLAGQPIEVTDTPCMLFTFADLQPRHEAHQALAHSERRFSAAFRLAPAPMLVLSAANQRVIDANAAFQRESGYAIDEIAERTECDIPFWDDAARAAIAKALHAGKPIRGLDVPLRGKDGTRRIYLLSAEAVTMDDEPCVLAVMQDIGDRKRTEGQLIEAIQEVLRDTSWFGQKVMEKLAELPGQDQAAAPGHGSADLSTREREILGLVAQGLSDAEMVARLGVTLSTVRNHVAAIYRKIGVHRRTAAVVWARERGFSAPQSGPRRKPARRRAAT